MSTILLGCDHNKTSEDKKTLQTIAKSLRAAGHTVEILNVGPNYTQTAMKKKSSKGKIAVFLVNGADLQTYKDFYIGITKGYYHVKYAYFGLEGWINQRTCTCSGAKNFKLGKAHDDASSVSFTKDIVGMTTAEVCEKYKIAIAYACGSSADELGNNLVKVIGGDSSSTTQSSSSGSSSSVSAKEAIKKLLTHWDGEVECRIRDGFVYINKIRDPQKSTNLLIQEKVNVFSDSISVADVNPNTVNHLTVYWSGGSIVFKDEDLIKRFGKIKAEVNAVKKVTKKVTKTNNNTNTNNNNNTDDADTENNTTNNNTENTNTDKTKTTTIEKPITKYEEALSFGNIEWNKIKRYNGHTLECQVWGSKKWQTGEWCRVILPSYDINGYMYITRVSQSDNSGDWTCSLSLVDYPPGWGVEQQEEEETDTSDTDTTDNATDTETETST